MKVDEALLFSFVYNFFNYIYIYMIEIYKHIYNDSH